MLLRQSNKMATGYKTHKQCSQSSNDHNCQIWQTISLVMEKMQFNHFLILSLCEPWQPNKTADQHTFHHL